MSQELLVLPDWRQILATPGPDGVPLADIRNIEHQCHMVFSLILFLNLSLRELLYFIFETNIAVVKQRAGIFMSYNPTWEVHFAPERIYRAWHEHFPRSRKHLHTFITEPCAKEIILDESNKIINDPVFKVIPRSCTMEYICDILNPGKLAGMYADIAPFMWSLLTVFTTAPNKHRKRRAGKETPTDTADEEWIEDTEAGMDYPPEFESKTSAHWRAQGFVRNATFVIPLSYFVCAIMLKY